MEAETIESLHNLVRTNNYSKPRYLRAYLHVIQNRATDYGAAERFLVRRLEGLEQVVFSSLGLGRSLVQRGAMPPSRRQAGSSAGNSSMRARTLARRGLTSAPVQTGSDLEPTRAP